MTRQSDNGPAGFLVEMAALLARGRGIGQAQAAAALQNDTAVAELMGRWPGDPPAELRAAISARAEALAGLAGCIQCGTCCLVSSPTLYRDDLGLVGEGGLAKELLYTLRAGEMAYSARLGQARPLERDLLKLREAEHGGCVLLEAGACAGYGLRPMQCRHLECWSGKNAGDLQGLERLDRRDLYQDDPVALALMDEYDHKVPAAELAGLLSRAARGEAEAAEAAVGLIDLDYRLRLGITQRYGYTVRELLVILGRAGLDVAQAHGLGVAVDCMGRPILNPLAPVPGN